MSAVIKLEGVKKSFASVNVLENISFSVERGEKVSLLGPGGCGKSTILKVLLGIIPPDDGLVELRGVDMAHCHVDQRQENLRKVGMAFQQGALFDYMTVEENLMFAMENMTDFDQDQMDKKITMLLDGVKLGKTRHMFPHELSGGMQRRVGIARALATEPEVAIFDEPTSGLDPVTSTIILNMINDLVASSEGQTSLVCTTNVEIGIRYAERIIMVHDGHVVADCPWRELLMDGPDWVRHFLSVRLIGLDQDYAITLDLPKPFIEAHW